MSFKCTFVFRSATATESASALMLVREGGIYYASSARSKFKDVLAVRPAALFHGAEDEFTRHDAAAEEPVLVTVGVVVIDVKPEEAWRLAASFARCWAVSPRAES